MTAPFILGENLVQDLARWRIEEAANDYLAKHAKPGAPRPNVTGEIAEAVARLAFTEAAALSGPLSTSMLIALMADAAPEEKEKLMMQLEQQI